MNDYPRRDTSHQPRRQFLQTALAATGAILAQPGFARDAAEGGPLPLTHPNPGGIPQKPFGKTGEHVSILGLGGYHLGAITSSEDAVRLVHEAIDSGVTFFDNAWEYHEGRGEEALGRALDGRRDKVFLMTKVCTHGRDKHVAMRQLEESLARLKTDHLDLWQVHEVIYENDPDWHFAAEGVMEALTEAKKLGKARFVGFTGHKHPSIHLKMLAHGYPFDAVQMPLNCFDGTYRSFERDVLPDARRRGMAVLGMKSLGGDGQPLLHGLVTPEEALRYAMSLPVATTISGIDSFSVLRQNLAIARAFQPMTEAEMDALRQRCAPYAADGHLELYKTSKHYDGKIGREQHGYPSPEEMPL
ncbi:MAG TPA: aldo/keto reductase [Verrucomicrobiae bacterium]|jgi:aryl-alcohol dehydrogenase-like predicted oxidoreductase|nr:aldo/keto reductase [Verrucomicrobiae bacterium]